MSGVALQHGVAAVILGVAGANVDDPASDLTFESDIRPIFRAHCFDCHGATEELKGGLDLRLVRLMSRGGASGPAIEPGQPGESHLLDRIRSGEMPPGEKRLSEKEIGVVEAWIAGGAATARPEPEEIGLGFRVTPEDRDFWSYQPIQRPDVAELPSGARERTVIDALIRAAMPQGQGFAADADRITLIKRAYFGLTGLPPSPEDIAQWTSDGDRMWFERLIDVLLESPHYGERWARHWLDVSGYADSEGYTASDVGRDWAWKYRDWVIRALNEDKPFNRFIVEQLAGDELAGPRDGDLTDEQIELLTATGFLRMAADGTGSGANTAADRNQVVADTIRIVSTSLMGLSVHCAQCHDHRYDPILQTDYYSLRAIFEPALDWRDWKTPQQRHVSLYTQADRKRASEVEAETKIIADERAARLAAFMAEALDRELKKHDEPLRSQLRDAYRAPDEKRTEGQKKLLGQHPSINITPGTLYLYIPESTEKLQTYDDRITAVRAKKPKEEFLRVLIEPANHVPETHLFHRGDHEQPKQTVVPAGLTVLAAQGRRREFATNDESLATTGRRLAFARWLTDGGHPLFARVIINRVWMHHFGRGLVATPADLGRLGSRPTHPKLLDWLADEFVQGGWSLKQVHRLVMRSTVYRQASARPVQSGPSTPGPTALYATKPLLRLEAETICDRILAAAGSLDRTLFGPPVAITEDHSGQVVVDGEQRRRSLYLRVRRSQPVAMLQAFDAPVMEINCESRPVSTVATQSLMLMNGEFMLRQAAKLAVRAAQEAQPVEPEMRASLPQLAELDKALPGQIVRAWQLSLCRDPSTDELLLASRFLAQQTAWLHAHPKQLTKGATASRQAITNLCQTLLSCNEFLYID